MVRGACLLILLIYTTGIAAGQFPSDSLRSLYNSRSGISQIETGLLLCKEMESEPEEMLDFSFSLFRRSKELEVEPLLMAEVLKAVSDAYYFNDSIKRSIEYLEKALGYAGSKTDTSYFLAEAYNDLGLNYIELEENRKALDYIGKSVAMFRTMNRPADLANAMSNLATVYYSLGQLDKAIALYNEVYLIDCSTGNEKSQSSSLNNLGRMYVDWGKYETGIDFYKRSLALLDSVSDREIFGIRYNNIGLAYQKMGLHRDAITWIGKALQFDNEENNKLKIGIRQFNLATSYLALNDLSKAKYYLEKAEDFFIHLNLPSRLTRVYGELGELYRQQDSLILAESYFLKAEQMAMKSGTIPEKAIADNYLYRFYKSTGQAVKALNYLEQLKANNDSIYKLEVAKKIEELEQVYQNEQKENEIRRLETENELRTNELIFRKRERNFALAGSVLLLIFSVSVFFLFKRVKSQKTEQARQNEELDRLNKTLSHLFGIISHDLRNATAAYQSTAKIISHYLGSGQPDKLLPLAPEISKNARQLSYMLENLLNWSAIQIKGIQPEKDLISVKQAVENVLFLYEELAVIKNNNLRSDIKDDTVWCDPGSFSLVIQNLVHNAIKYTAGGEITLKSFSDNGTTVIEIADTGCGMDPATIDVLTKKIHPRTKNGTDGERGTGLGLLMTAEHVEKNGGTLTISSIPLKGTSIHLTFPNHRL